MKDFENTTTTDAVPTSDFAWKIYNFINAYKRGWFGCISLQQALDKYFKTFDADKYEWERPR